MTCIRLNFHFSLYMHNLLTQLLVYVEIFYLQFSTILASHLNTYLMYLIYT